MSRRPAWGLAALVVAGGLTSATAATPTVNVRIFQFRPAQVQVASGTDVTWTNDDDIQHTVTSGTPERPDGRFDLKLGEKGATASLRLDRPGVYPYFCSRHQHMRGEIRVN